MDNEDSGGRENDNTVFVLGNIDIETNQREVEYIKAENGLNSQKQIVMIKRLFYDYKCTYFVMDSKGETSPFYIVIYNRTEKETGKLKCQSEWKAIFKRIVTLTQVIVKLLK